MKDHVIICGLGDIGFRVFKLLHRAGIQVAVISNKTHGEWAWQIEHSGGAIFYGDARDDNLLLDAGIKDARAIIALTNQDRVNLSIATDAQKLNPTIKIISRIYDTELGNLVADAFGIEQVFSTSELAAPVFANNVTDGKTIGQFNFKEQHFLVSEEETNNIEENSVTQVLSTQHNENLIAKPSHQIKKKTSKFLSFINHYSLRTPVFIFFRRFIIILFFIILFSTLFLEWAMSLSFIDALYFVIATVSSVGYGDINFLSSSNALKYFGCLLMLTGTAIIAILFSSVTEMILSKKLPNIRGGHSVPHQNHVIIVGSDHIGTRIVSTLIDNNIPLVIIENDMNEHYPEDIARQVALVRGNPKSENTLLRANIKSAKAILAVTKDDIENLSITLAAKKLNPTITEVTQINNTSIGGTLQKALQLIRVFSVPYIAAPYFLAALFKQKIVFAVEWRNQIIYLWDDNGVIKKDILTLSHIQI